MNEYGTRVKDKVFRKYETVLWKIPLAGMNGNKYIICFSFTQNLFVDLS